MRSKIKFFGGFNKHHWKGISIGQGKAHMIDLENNFLNEILDKQKIYFI
jgi:hypothetical protein